MVVSLTQLQSMLGIEHGEFRFVCSCLAMETHLMKLSTSSAYADVASRVSLELGSQCCNGQQTIFLCLHSAVPFCELVWSTISQLSQLIVKELLDISTSQ